MLHLSQLMFSISENKIAKECAVFNLQGIIIIFITFPNFNVIAYILWICTITIQNTMTARSHNFTLPLVPTCNRVYCEQVCTDTPSGSYCSCLDGYYLDKDNQSCIGNSNIYRMSQVSSLSQELQYPLYK